MPEERSLHAFRVGVGRAAEPEIARRRLLGAIPVFAAVCVSGGSEENVERSRL